MIQIWYKHIPPFSYSIMAMNDYGILLGEIILHILQKVWDKINEFVSQTRANGFFENNRREQAFTILNDTIEESLKSNFYSDPTISKLIDNYKKQIFEDEVNPYEVAHLLLNEYFAR